MADLTIGDIGDVAAPEPAATSTTTQQVIDQTKRWLLTGAREQRNKLAVAVSANATTLTFTYALDGIKAGSRVSIDLEDYHVYATPTSTTATVDPAQYGSVSAAHLINSIVFVNPKFSQNEMFFEMKNEMQSLSAAGVYRVATLDLTASAAREAYNLTSVTSAEDILALSYESIGATGEYLPLQNYRLQRNLPTGDFASGFALTINDYVDPGRTIRVAYRTAYTLPTTLSDDIVSAGFPSSALDVLAMGTALRMSTSREIRRNFNEEQGDTRRADEVPAGANNQAPAGLRQMYLQRRAEEVGNLKRRYPPRRP